MKIAAILITVIAVAAGGGLASGFYLVAPNSGGFPGELRKLSLQIDKLTFSCDKQAETGKRIFENPGAEPEAGFSASREWFEMALACNSPVALHHLGYMYVNGLSVEQDSDKGVAMLEQAKSAGYSEAAKTLAREYYDGVNIPWDYSLAVSNFEICGREGDAFCKARLAELVAYYADQPNYFRAFELAESAARSAEPRAQGILASLYLSGRGTTTDVDAARSWAEKAMSEEDPYALESLATIYLEGRGVPPDARKAIEFYKTMAKNGNSDAYAEIGRIFEYGSAGVEQNFETAAEYYLKAAKAGVVEAEMAIGIFYFQGIGVGKDEAEAYRWLKKAADRDEPSANMYLGRLYLHGVPSLNIEPNNNKAWYYIKKAADLGESEAKSDVGWMYYRGLGVAKSKRSAFVYANAAAESGVPDGQALLGYLLITGTGTSKNSAQGVSWLEQASNQGSALGLGYLGQAYFQGIGVPKDVPKSRDLFERAFRAGHSESAAYLGAFYEYGVEYDRDLPRAYAYYDFSARHGSQDGEQMRKKLAETISPEQAGRARAILQELNEITSGVTIY
jgi:TPR repeat protein